MRWEVAKFATSLKQGLEKIVDGHLPVGPSNDPTRLSKTCHVTSGVQENCSLAILGQAPTYSRCQNYFTSLLSETHPATQNQEDVDTLSGLRLGHFDGRHPTIAAGEIICPEFWVVTGWARQGFYALKQFLLWQVRSYHLA